MERIHKYTINLEYLIPVSGMSHLEAIEMAGKKVDALVNESLGKYKGDFGIKSRTSLDHSTIGEDGGRVDVMLVEREFSLLIGETSHTGSIRFVQNLLDELGSKEHRPVANEVCSEQLNVIRWD